MDKLAVACKQRSVRLIDFFRAHDRLRSGTIPRTIFHRTLATALDITSVLTTVELRTLEANFCYDTDKFYYERFLAALEQSEAKVPVVDTSFSRATQHQVEINPTSPELLKLEDELKTKVHAERIDLLTCFRAFDQRRTGRVLRARFVRCFPFHVPERLVELVTQRYATCNLEVDYSSWLAHLQLPAGMGEESFKQEDAIHSPSAPPRAKAGASPPRAVTTCGLTVSAARVSHAPAARNAAELVGDIADATRRVNVRIVDFIVDRDAARCGLVPIPAFESALGRVHIPGLVLDTDAVDRLVEEYKVKAPTSGDWRVDYRRFARDVQAAQGDEHAKSARRNQMTDSEVSRVNVVIERIRDSVRARRINMFPSFRDFDKVTSGTSGNRTCTANRFARALTVNGIQIDEQDTKLLVRYFAVKTPGEFDSDAIDYESFCNLAHDQEKMAAEEEALRNQRSVKSRQEAADAQRAAFAKPILHEHDLDEVLDAVATQVNKRQVRLQSFFSDFDHHKSGAIPAQKFESVLGTCKITLQLSDIARLVEYYAHPTLPRTVCYVRLLDDIKDRPLLPAVANTRAVTGPFALPTKTNAEALKSIDALHACSEGTGEKAGNGVDAVIQRVREAVRTRGILLPPFFCDYDRNKMGLITRTQFVQTLARHPLPLAPSDTESLATHFADKSVPTHVRWKEFVAAVDDIENPELLRSAAGRERSELQRRIERANAMAESSQMQIDAAAADQREWSPRSIFATSVTAPGAAESASAAAAADKSIDALDSLHKLILTRRVRLQQFLCPETIDPLRHGTCTADRFLSSLCMAGLRLTQEQSSSLTKRYTTAHGEVDYVRFLHDMDAAEATTQLDRTYGTCAATRLSCGRDKLLRAMERDTHLKATVEHIQRVAAARRLQTRPVFEAHDKLRLGTVTEAQFLNSLSGPLTIHLEPRQSRALLDALAVPRDPKSLAASNPILGAVVAFEGFCSIVDQ